MACSSTGGVKFNASHTGGLRTRYGLGTEDGEVVLKISSSESIEVFHKLA